MPTTLPSPTPIPITMLPSNAWDTFWTGLHIDPQSRVPLAISGMVAVSIGARLVGLDSNRALGLTMVVGLIIYFNGIKDNDG